jgi:hypothetical protein
VANGSTPGAQASIAPSQKGAAVRTSHVVSGQELASRESILQEHLERRANLPNHAGVGTAGGPTAAVAAAAPEAGTESTARAITVQAPGTFTVSVNSVPPTVTGATNVMEPTEAQSGANVFYTGNWFAAQSGDGGTTWTPVDPYAQYLGVDGFCCDQEVVHDAGRDQWDWVQLGNRNTQQLNVSTDGTSTWCSYLQDPSIIGIANGSFDQPRLTYTNNYLYITNNIFSTIAPFSFITQSVQRWPLDVLQTCGPLGFDYWTGLSGWAGAANGGTTTAYIGDHRGFNNQFRIWYIPETAPSGAVNTTMFFADRAIPAFNFENANGVCTATPGGVNWVARSDSRIETGAIIRGEERAESRSLRNEQVVFMWNAAQGGGFPQPYVEAAGFRLWDLAYATRPLWWSGSACVHYPALSSARTDTLGLTQTYSDAGTNPSVLFGIVDDFDAFPPGWPENYFLRLGGGTAVRWGDYVRNSGFDPYSTGWASAGHTMSGGVPTPGFWVVNRERDQPSIDRGLTLP